MIPSAHTEQSPTAARLHQAWKARREREAAAARRMAATKQTAPVAPPEPPKPVDFPVFRLTPLIKAPTLRKDASAHVDAYRAWQKMRAETLNPVRFIKLGCEAHGVPYDVMVSNDKSKSVWAVRKALICMVSQRFPKLSISHIGRLFNRDHSSIVSALGRKGKGRAPKTTPEQVREIRRRYDEGESPATIAADVGVKYPTTIKIARRMLWRSVE